MNEFWKSILIGLLGGLFAGVGLWLLDWIREQWLFWRDQKRIVDFMEREKGKDYDWRSTQVLASNNNLTLERVYYVCSYSKKIKRNELDNEVWELKK